MNNAIANIIAFLLLTSTTNSQDVQNPNGAPLGFPFQLRRGMTISEVAERMDLHFGNKHRREPTSPEYKLFDLSEPIDSLFFDGVGPVAHLSYSFFKDTLRDVLLEFPKYGRTIDTARFVRSYSYKNGFYLSSTLALRDSSFIMVINPRMDCPAISFTDMEVEERMDQYRRLLEKQLAEDSVVIVVTAPGGMPSLSERVLRGEEKWSPSPLSFGERVTFEELKTTIEFKGIGVRKSHRGEELTTKNATIFLTVDHNGLKREVAISADTDRSCSYCQCVGIADDLPTWIVCASMFKKLSDTYQILVNINQSLRN